MRNEISRVGFFATVLILMPEVGYAEDGCLSAQMSCYNAVNSAVTACMESCTASACRHECVEPQLRENESCTQQRSECDAEQRRKGTSIESVPGITRFGQPN